jgi:very-short-patch-repair endonuclease
LKNWDLDRNIHRPAGRTEFARELRKKSTDAERLLWRWLRSRRLEGAKFRRNAPIGNYIVDFCCHSAALIIELDGGGHFTPEEIEYDEQRTNELKGAGWRVIRFTNAEVMLQLPAVLEKIWNELI